MKNDLPNAGGLTGKMQNIYGDIANITGQVSVCLEGDVSNISGDVTNLEGEISDVKGDVSNIHGNVGDMSSCILGDVSNIKGDVSFISGDTSFIKGDVSFISGDVSFISGDVYFIKGDVSNISGDVSRISGDVSALSGDVSDLTGNVANISGENLASLPPKQEISFFERKAQNYIKAYKTFFIERTPEAEKRLADVAKDLTSLSPEREHKLNADIAELIIAQKGLDSELFSGIAPLVARAVIFAINATDYLRKNAKEYRELQKGRFSQDYPEIYQTGLSNSPFSKFMEEELPKLENRWRDEKRKLKVIQNIEETEIARGDTLLGELLVYVSRRGSNATDFDALWTASNVAEFEKKFDDEFLYWQTIQDGKQGVNFAEVTNSETARSHASGLTI